ncbi:hypothetical protein RUM44_004785 [Polyplax serrata]|uniref:Cytochrome c oxidase assembly factor 3 mitochondrial coiled-coil domain-containing protein n=1 Tax=Polyplax serrata TaxID=468196 RepID=A0ABR1B3U2_POLSC
MDEINEKKATSPVDHFKTPDSLPDVSCFPLTPLRLKEVNQDIMSDNESMPKVNFKQSESLKKALTYSKWMEEKNLERALIAKKTLRNKRKILFGSLAVVFGIYAYTIGKISQETFLDNFDEPETIN